MIEAAAKIVQDFNRTFVMPQFLEKDPEQTYQEIMDRKTTLEKATGGQAKPERELAKAQASQLLELAMDTSTEPITFRLALNLNWRTGAAAGGAGGRIKL